MDRRIMRRAGGFSIAVMVYVTVVLPLVHPLFHARHGFRMEGSGARGPAIAERLESAAVQRWGSCPICRSVFKYKAICLRVLILSGGPVIRPLGPSPSPESRTCPPLSLPPCRSPPAVSWHRL